MAVASMTDPRELLDAYAAESDWAAVEGKYRQYLAPKAFAALRAVLDLHVPDPAVRARVVCKHCVAVRYPCPTVQAIARALEGK